jgi:hypothetical protein
MQWSDGTPHPAVGAPRAASHCELRPRSSELTRERQNFTASVTDADRPAASTARTSWLA